MRALVLAALVPAVAVPAERDPGATLTRVSHGGASYDVLVADLRHVEVRAAWTDGSGAPYRDFATLLEARRRTGAEVLAVTNAGIYEEAGFFRRALRPSGLLVADGAELRPLNTARGEGNFYLRPSGVFLVRGGVARVLSTDAYASERPAADAATQSGPLLVSAGRLHPSLSPGSKSLHVRNGVGVRPTGEVVVAISREPVTLHAFATAFRDALGCPDALYLDGTISALHAPALGRSDPGRWPFATFLTIERKRNAPRPSGPGAR